MRDFPKGERIEIETFTLDGIDVRFALFKPGTYKLVMQQPGYHSIEKNISIPPGDKPFLIQEEMITKSRVLVEKISYDRPLKTPPYIITLAPLDKPNREKVVKRGDLVKPGSYILRIRKKGYKTLEERKHIWPDSRPITIEEKLTLR